MSARRWRCPDASHSAVNAPERMRRDDTRRFCFPCSEVKGRLVQRVCEVASKRRAVKAAKRAAEQAEVRKTARERLQKQIDQAATYCGPAVLAKRLGIKRTRAVRLLAQVGDGTVRGPCSEWRLIQALRRRGERFDHYQASGTQTVRQWRDTNPGATAILTAGHHFLYLSSGRLVEDNGWKMSRARVQYVIRFDKPGHTNPLEQLEST